MQICSGTKRSEESLMGKPKDRNQRQRVKILSTKTSNSRAETVEFVSDFRSVGALWCNLDLKLKVKKHIIFDIWQSIIYYVFTELLLQNKFRASYGMGVAKGLST